MTVHWVVVVLSLLLLGTGPLDASSAQDNPENGDVESPGIKINYDEYPMIVPKRAALVLDRIMVMLQRALEEQESMKAGRGGRDGGPLSQVPAARVTDRGYDGDVRPRMSAETAKMGLQRRDYGTTVHPKGKIWRCLFNAVTCFRRK